MRWGGVHATWRHDWTDYAAAMRPYVDLRWPLFPRKTPSTELGPGMRTGCRDEQSKTTKIGVQKSRKRPISWVNRGLWTCRNRLNAFSYSVTYCILCILLYFVNLNFIMVYIEPITQLWRNVFVMFDMILGSESYVWSMMWRLIAIWHFYSKFKSLCRM